MYKGSIPLTQQLLVFLGQDILRMAILHFAYIYHMIATTE
jgi:hypothetical protein